MNTPRPLAESLLPDLIALQQQAARGVVDAATRRRWLDGVARMICDHQQAWAQAVSADFGHRSSDETRLLELFPALQGVRYARRRVARWMRPQRRSVSWWFWPARASVRPTPLGVVGVIVPWNYPIFLALGPLVSALAAGNRVMVKMSELSPATGALLAQLAKRYLGDDVVRVVNGGVEVAEAFAGLPFDHLLFTGSGRVGRRVMQAAAANLTPVTLELGGKSPALVTPGFDLRRAAASLVAGKMRNAGQTCVAPDYLLVHEDDCAALLAAIHSEALRAYPTLVANPDYSSIISDAHYQRLLQWRDQAQAAGARLQIVGHDDASALAACRKLPLTLIEHAPAESAVMSEEIFGPLLPVVRYRTLDEALAYIRQRERPLALYLFDDHPRRVERMLGQLVVGGVTVNDTLLHVAQDALPFGGVGPSGMGHYHGYEGFLTFSKLLPVLQQARIHGSGLLHAPYGRLAARLLRWMLR